MAEHGSIVIRDARLEDAARLLEIYDYYVRQTAITFEYETPCCELTVYLAQNARRCGMGRRLYEALEQALREMGVCNLYACIACPEQEDEYLTGNSAAFHEHLGFRQVGLFRACGYKFGRWYHMVWMEKIIGVHRAKQPPVQAYR